ncbi:MAG: zinc ABC transporter substrate-binding protein [Magnetococcales bacterium]|nr:zinc ABC transporter substrate-binding protein [Magnetococcales bacterium]
MVVAMVAALVAMLGVVRGAVAEGLKVVATFSILGDMARQVGGAHVQVTTLIGPNGDPHAYEPTPEDAGRLKEAKVVIANGLGLEGWMARLIAASGFQGQPVVASAGVKVRNLKGEGGRSSVDPHAWNSAANGAIYVGNIVRAFVDADPAHAAAYQAHGARYAAELERLDAHARARLAAIPADRRRVLTTHDAFGYFADAYGLTLLSPLGFSTGQEASAGGVAGVIRQIRETGVRVYFLENSGDPRLVEQIGAATGARSGGALYVESLSAADGPAATYRALFEHNLDQVVRALAAVP